MKIKTKCDYCGKNINKPLWMIGDYKTHFCNYKCRKKFFIKKRVDIMCTHCGRNIKKSLWQMKGNHKNHFCNYGCVKKFRNINSNKMKTICSYCGKNIKKTPWEKKNIKLTQEHRRLPHIDEVSPDYYKGYLAGGNIDLQNKEKIE